MDINVSIILKDTDPYTFTSPDDVANTILNALGGNPDNDSCTVAIPRGRAVGVVGTPTPAKTGF